MKSREWCVCNCNLKKMFMGFHLKIKIIHRHIWVEKRKFCRLKISWACITGQIVFVLESFGSKATRSERLLLILHMALQLDLYQNFVPLETYRFKEEDDYEYKIWLDVFSRILKIKTSRKASFYLFSLEKLALLPLVKGGYTLSRSQND